MDCSLLIVDFTEINYMCFISGIFPQGRILRGRSKYSGGSLKHSPLKIIGCIILNHR